MIGKFKQWPGQRANTASCCPDGWYFCPGSLEEKRKPRMRRPLRPDSPGRARMECFLPGSRGNKNRVGNTTRRINRRKALHGCQKTPGINQVISYADKALYLHVRF